MHEILLILLGSLLTIAGGFIQNYYKNCQHKKNLNRNFMFEALNLLIECYQIENAEKERQKIRSELAKIAVRINSKKYLGIAKSLFAYSLKPEEENRGDLLKRILKENNEPFFNELYAKHSKEMKKEPEND